MHALRLRRRGAAHHAHRELLGDHVGDDEEARHRAEGAAEVVLLEAGDDDAGAAIGEALGDVDDAFVEELRLVDADDGDGAGLLLQLGVDLGARRDGHRVDARGGVAHDVARVVAVVDARLEHEHALAGDARAAQAFDELFGFAREHRAADDFDVAAGRKVDHARHPACVVLGGQPRSRGGAVRTLRPSPSCSWSSCWSA